ncbi:MAG: serine O-acetyltransferase [Bacteroidota bacterium]
MSEEIFIQQLFQRNRKSYQAFPDKVLVENFIDDLFNFLFGSYEKKFNSAEKLSAEYHELRHTFSAILFEVIREEKKVKEHTSSFFNALPSLYKALLEDADAVLAFDPAAQSIEEVLVAYPGFYATAIYRLSNQLYRQQIKTLPRLFSEYAHSKTGIDIHPGAVIGTSFAIDHGTGIVIGETTVIGERVKIYQGVTLGALNVDKELASTKRHPTIEDDVIIYSGATILGGGTVIGAGSIIGGNIWLTHSVAANSVVYHKSEIKIKDKDPFPEPLNFVI